MGRNQIAGEAVKRVLVTGGGGFVGSHIARQVLAQGVECLVLGRNTYPALESLGVTCLRGDVCDASFVAKSTEGVDTVFHVAAMAGIWGQWRDYYRINVQGTKNVLAACRANSVARLVYTSTPSVVFSGRDIHNGNEQLPYASRCLCHYATSKVMAEKLVLEGGGGSSMPLCCAIRPHLVWGPGDPHLIPRLLLRGRQKQLKKVGSGANMVDISYVENVAEAHLLAARNLETTRSAAGQAYFISQGEPVNLWEWINELFLDFDIPPVRHQVPFAVAYWGGALLEGLHSLFGSAREPKMTRFLAEQLAKSHSFSIAKARKDLGYTPRISTEEGMRRLIKSYTK